MTRRARAHSGVGGVAGHFSKSARNGAPSVVSVYVKKTNPPYSSPLKWPTRPHLASDYRRRKRELACAERQQFRHVQSGHGRILRFLDHEDPSLRLDHNPAPSRLSCLRANRARKRHLYLASLRLKKRAQPNPLQKERSCVLIVYTRLPERKRGTSPSTR